MWPWVRRARLDNLTVLLLEAVGENLELRGENTSLRGQVLLLQRTQDLITQIQQPESGLTSGAVA